MGARGLLCWRRGKLGMAESELQLAWPIDLGLTVASHGWVHLEPWRWEAETGALSHAERIGDRHGTVSLRQRDPRMFVASWDGFPASRAEEILWRVRRWISADWDPSPAIAVLGVGFAEEAALVARGGGR